MGFALDEAAVNRGADVTVVAGDVTDRSAVFAAIKVHGVSRIIHLASLLGTTTSLDPTRGINVNSIGTEHVFSVAKEASLERVVWASSQSVYRRRGQYESLLGGGTVTEDDPPIPRDVYGGTKLVNELLAEQCAASGLDVVGLRPVLTIGPAQQFGAVGILINAMRDAVVSGHGVVGAPWTYTGRSIPFTCTTVRSSSSRPACGQIR